MKTKITFLALICTVFSFAQVGIIFTAGGLKYKITAATTVEVAQNPTTIAGAIVIPETVSFNSSNYSVTVVGDKAFQGCASLTSITIPNSVTNIYDAAFSFCTGLTSVTIPNSVTNIYSGAFYGCTSLTSVTIPNSVTSIGDWTFYNCEGLTSVTIPNSVTSIGDYAFNNCTGLTSAAIPNSVISISTGTFLYCSGLTSVTIPNSVTSIGDYAFNNCSGLTAVTIPSSVTTIGGSAFTYCIGLTSITIPNSVTSIGAYTFSDCLGLTSVTIPNSVTSIGDAAFVNCPRLTAVTIPNSITSISNYTFNNCTGLTSVTIPNSVTTIGDRAFDGCSSLISVTIPNSVWIIGNRAFDGCSSLISVTIPNSVRFIDAFAFSGCTGLTAVTAQWTSPFPILKNVFDQVPIANVTLLVPEGLEMVYKAVAVWKEFGTIIEYVAPVKGQKIVVNGINYIVTNATLPYEVAVATDNQGSSGRFTNAVQTGISGEVIIPATFSSGGNLFSVTGISAFAFQNSTGITSISIPSSVLIIGDFAFANCSGLTAVAVNWTAPIAINRNVFENITLTPIPLNVPIGTETAYAAANVWKEFKISTLGTNQFSLNNAVKFYPNPTQSQINFNEEINTLDVFDIAGKKVKTFQNPSTNYDVASLQKGVYILKGTTTDGKSFNEKLVKE